MTRTPTKKIEVGHMYIARKPDTWTAGTGVDWRLPFIVLEEHTDDEFVYVDFYSVLVGDVTTEAFFGAKSVWEVVL